MAKKNKIMNQASKVYNSKTEFEESTKDEKLQRMLNKTAQLEEELEGAIGTADYADIAEKLGFQEEKTFQYSTVVDTNITEKAKKVYAKSFATQAGVNNTVRRSTTLSSKDEFTSMARKSPLVNMSTDELQRRYQSSIDRSIELNESGAEAVRKLKPNQDTNHISEIGEASWHTDREAATYKAIISRQGEMGLSTKKLDKERDELKRDYRGYQRETQLDKDVSSGKYGSGAAEQKKLDAAHVKMKEAEDAKASASSTGMIGKELEVFSDALKEATAVVKEQTEVTKKVKSNEASGGGGFGGKNWNAISQFAQFGLQTVGATAQAYKDITVTNDIKLTNNRAAYAKTANDIYDKAGQAVSGHSVDAMLDVAENNFAKNYSDKMKKRTNVAEGVKATTDTATNVLKYAAIGRLVGTGVGIGAAVLAEAGSGGVATPFLGAIAAGGTAAGTILGTAYGAAISAPNIHATYKGIHGQEAGLEAYHSKKNLTKEERYVATQNMQAFYDQGLNTYQTVQGMGSSASGKMQARLMDGANLKYLAKAGISPADAARLTGMLGAAGSMSGGTEDGMRIIEGSGRASQRGQMGQQEYVSAASRMVAAGGKADDLEKIISSAMTQGMDNSKNLGQMVDATLQMSSGLAARGAGGTSMMQDQLSGMSQFLIGQGVNKNLSIPMAAAGVADLNSGITDKSFNLGNIMERAALQSMPELNKASHFQKNKIASFSFEQLKLLESDTQEARDLATREGLDNLLMKDGKMNKSLVKKIGKEAMRGALVNAGAPGTVEGREIMDKYGTGKKLSAEATAVFGADTRLGDVATFNAMGGVITTKTTSREEYLKAHPNLGSGADVTQANYEADQVGSGKKDALDLLGGQKGQEFSQIEGLAKSIAQAVDPNKWGAEVKKAAEGFSVSGLAFLTATGDLDKTVDKLVKFQAQMLKQMGDTQSSIPSEKKSWYSDYWPYN